MNERFLPLLCGALSCSGRPGGGLVACASLTGLVLAIAACAAPERDLFEAYEDVDIVLEPGSTTVPTPACLATLAVSTWLPQNRRYASFGSDPE